MKSPAVTHPRRYVQRARAEAAQATARRIIDAFLGRLMTQWYDEITLEGVADDAGVTVQTTVRRFGGKDGLLAEAAKVLGTQITTRRSSPASDLERLVTNLLDDYEETGDAVIRLLALEARHPAVRDIAEFGRREHRAWVATAFAESLGRLGLATRQRTLDALVIATDVYVWKLLRRDMRKSRAAAADILNGLVRAALAQFANPTSRETTT
jgi:AcrR family transcriptional regulator